MVLKRNIKYFLSGMGNSILKLAGVDDATAVTSISKKAPKIGLSNIWSIATYWQGVDLIAGRLSGISLDVMEEDKKTVAENHPLQRLFKEGIAEYYDSIDLVKVIVVQLLTSGNSFLKINYDLRGERIGSMEFLDPSATFPRVEKGKLVFDSIVLGDSARSLVDIESLEHRGDHTVLSRHGSKAMIETRGDAQMRKYSSDEIFHIKGMTRDGINGISPIQACNPVLQLAFSSVVYGLNYFANDARPSTVLSPKQPLSKVQAQNIVKAWTEENGGINNRGVTVLPKGMEVHALNVPPDESQSVGARMESVRDVGRVLNIPGVLLGDTAASTYNNVREAYVSLDNNTLEPIANRITSAANRQLVERPYSVRFDWESHLTSPQGERFNSYSTAIAGKAFLLIDEVRAMEGKRPLTDEEKEELLSYSEGQQNDQEQGQVQGQGQSQGQIQGQEEEVRNRSFSVVDIQEDENGAEKRAEGSESETEGVGK